MVCSTSMNGLWKWRARSRVATGAIGLAAEE